MGDWIVGTGSANSPIGDIRSKVVYVMRISQNMTMQVYDTYTRQYLPNKIPSWHDPDKRKWVGDSIYDFDAYPPNLRKSVHKDENRARDLSGEFALLSDHFYYFGDQPKQLPGHLLPIVKTGPGHRSISNAPYLIPLLEWLYGLGLEPNRLYGNPLNPLNKCRSC